MINGIPPAVTTRPTTPTSSTAAGSTFNVGVAVGASVGGVVCVVLLVAAVWRWRKYLSQVHSCSSLVQVFVPCS
jgi:predicted MFS family arabinose efflux permease